MQSKQQRSLSLRADLPVRANNLSVWDNNWGVHKYKNGYK